MFLKKIEIFGFKSFAEKATMEFSRGTSAIIGPNGCGKSNIIDAIRWTLGEQSVKTLRGGRMEDVIFSGSEKRKPLNFAEVSLRFEDVDSRLNSDYTEMEITRRLYRSGESEYYINKTPCRLKDINELFMDTGIGKEVYSIVGQNRVEEIITAKPEERRELIEEAAGVLKYKHRKREAKRRLDDMKDNLRRVYDLIYELENQMEPLKDQAAIARKYKELKNRMKENERKILNYRIGNNKKEIEKVVARLTDVQDESVDIMTSLTDKANAIEELQKKLDEVNERRNKLERELNKYLQDKEQIEGRIRLLEERETNLLKQKEENISSKNNLKKRREELQAANKNREQQIAEKDNQVEGLKTRINGLKDKIEQYKNDNSLLLMEKLQQELLTATSRRESLESTSNELERRMDNINKQIAENENQSGKEGNKLNSVKEKSRALSDGKERNNLIINKIKHESDENKLKLKQCREEIELQRSQLATVKEELSSNENKLWLLKKLEEDKTPLQKGAEELLNNDFPEDGLLGSVFSLINVPRQFRPGIEAALGDKVFGVLASDEDAAIRAVNHLKNKKRGWTFIFPVNLIKNHEGWNFDRDKLKEIPGFIGVASDLVQTDAKNTDLANWLLGNIVVTDNFNAALVVARETNYAVYAVTTEGDAVYPGGIIHGGRDNEDKEFYWDREEEIRNLELLLPKYLQKKEQTEKKMTELQKHEDDLLKRDEELRKREGNIKEEINDTVKEEALLLKEREHIELNIAKYNQAMSELKEEQSGIIERRDSLKKELKEIENKQSGVSEKLENLKESYRHVLEARDTVTNTLTQQRIEYNKILEQKNYLQKSFIQTENDLKSIEKNINERNDSFKEIEKLLDEVKVNKKEEFIKKDYLARDSKENSVEYEEAKKISDELKAAKTELEKEEQNLKNKSTRLEKKGHRLELEKTRLISEREHQINLFKDKFGTTSEAEEAIYDLDEAEVLKNVENIRQEIEMMGHVRIGAIDELERLSERINFLRSQEEDLKKGEESLKEILNQIDEKIKNRFIGTMEEIRSNFKDTFLELFGGGQALVRFTEEDNILESGIDIDVQPPGKNLKNISLLSSGEKALTSIALLFAIFKYKPAPFYFLDEIESSLDDNNLTRFTEFMDKASQNSQFILITHRQKTMEKANLVYGVTMPESGVSRAISLKLTKKAS